EKCQLKQSTGTGNVFAVILTADPSTLHIHKAVRITSGTHFSANERSTSFAAHLNDTVSFMRLFGFV
ncbi:MAG: hypothetical protein IJE14_09740, partial [Clostridia bacterium]|nr:hypothetical protein [Clostridia bacterium]